MRQALACRPPSAGPIVVVLAARDANANAIKLPGERTDSWEMRIRATLVALFLAVNTTGTAEAALSVSTEVTVRNGNWFPLPVQDMQAAAGDAALAEISDAGLLALVAPGMPAAGALALDLSLMGRAETAQMTITLTLPAHPSFVSTASISVRRLDYGEIHRALQHVGREAALRMNAKLRAARVVPGESPPTTQLAPSDPALQKAFDDAQAAKHALRFNDARASFERVARAGGDGETLLMERARDELRYGLPAFEAKQAILGMAGQLGELSGKFTSITRAENLYRQILAENPERPARLTEAQRALDDLAVTRRAMKNAIWSVSVNRMSHLRMSMMEILMIEGRCPDERTVRQLLVNQPFALELARFEQEESGTTHTGVRDPATDIEIELICDQDVRLAQPPVVHR